MHGRRAVLFVSEKVTKAHKLILLTGLLISKNRQMLVN